MQTAEPSAPSPLNDAVADRYDSRAVLRDAHAALGTDDALLLAQDALHEALLAAELIPWSSVDHRIDSDRPAAWELEFERPLRWDADSRQYYEGPRELHLRWIVPVRHGRWEVQSDEVLSAERAVALAAHLLDRVDAGDAVRDPFDELHEIDRGEAADVCGAPRVARPNHEVDRLQVELLANDWRKEA